MKSTRTAVSLLLLALLAHPARSQEVSEEPAPEAVEAAGDREAPPVGGIFGLFGRGRGAPTQALPAEPIVAPAPAPPAVTEPPVVAPAPTPKPAARATVIPEEEEKDEEEKAAVEPGPAEPREESSAPVPPTMADEAALPEPAVREPAERRGKSDVELPTEEILGEIEKPDIFFLVPRARDQSDEQMIRARIRREINRPVIKDWIEEEMLLK
ncbi:MAG: hypothetical protein ACREQQ_07125 [Candidatus Binatia bacterium]